MDHQHQPEMLCRRLETLVSVHPDYFYMFDREHRFTYVSPALLQLWGMSEEEVVGKNFEDLDYPKHLIELHEEQLTRAFRGEQVKGENAYVSPAGEEGYYEYIFTPVFGGSTVESVVGVTRDITERRRCEMEAELLARAGALLSEAVEMPQILRAVAEAAVPILADVAAVAVFDDGKIEGIEVAAADGLSADGGSATLRGGFEQLLQSELSGSEPTALDIVSSSTPDEPGWIVVPVQSEAEVLGAVGVWCEPGQWGRFAAMDVGTTRKLARWMAVAVGKSRMYERMQFEVDLREDVLALVSHDLRSPLGVIDMGLNTLDKLLGQERRSKVAKTMAALRRSVTSMSRMISDLLDMSQLRTNTFDVQIEECDLQSVVEDAVNMHRPQALEADLRIETAVSGDLHVQCDRDRIAQVMANLLGNAIKFCDSGCTITVKGWQTDDFVHVSVSDEGPGIPERKLERIFEPYWTANSAEGTGLGLFIARGILKAHGGELSVQSSVGEGTTFEFRLPRRPDQ